MQTKTFFAIAHTDISSETGGPPGYLYNLLSGFDGNDRPDILVLNSNTNSRTEVYTSLDGVKSHHLVDILRSTLD